MARVDKRFQLLMTEEELELLKKEAEKRNLSAGEMLRLSFRNEVYRSDSYERLEALKILSNLKLK
ncbi:MULTISPECIES: CopG family transcriptional regulator [Leptospira]|uniref:CopG family transcriptional regulator n=3 Tax=Leptospira kirschneri TaxID=29507 RepID=A0A1T1E220_9LEPT|nr:MULTISPECIES: CopG family transcriptional regulator [Leptospira]EMO75578.1 ribbon-helix-helix protein, CopG family [Leptospira kirschneri str. 200801925]EJO69768.1 ribbon-helix-helix protein, CopG family [Leptospira kirschneri serovar Grippotyphosa str. RM52]EKO13684.1 ribbon-helix-helix protein, CopG family [Leptospira kirschneri str. H1]EKO52278.1 ribbon-helix-helix protein, CopG family [Leptospira kirschneri str. 200802841]EKP06462.1 ribbon-helix-helix protein, CopG family [Leptospira ki